MRSRLLAASLSTSVGIALLPATVARVAADSNDASPEPAPAGRALDRISDRYLPYVDPKDPLGFPLKIRSLAQCPIALWRGGKDLFYLWCNSNAHEWMDDRDAYVTQQGDQHLGNIGTYLTPGDPFGGLGFGMVDYDESARLPFQYELLQGLITLQMTASTADIDLSQPDIERLTDVLLKDYQAAAVSSQTSLEMLHEDTWVQRLIDAREQVSYGKELKSYLTNDRHFVPARVNKKGELKDLLRPADERADEIAKGISDALGRDAAAAKLFRANDIAFIRSQIRSVAQRTRMGSAGSQGLKKYFVLLDRPLEGFDHDVVIYLKQQIPSAAERSGLIAMDPRPCGERASQDSQLLDHPAPLLSSWCELGKESYWLSFRDPWTRELDAKEITTLADLFEAAHIWAIATGASHRQTGDAKRIADRITPALSERLRKLAGDYVRQTYADYVDLATDPRVKQLRADTDETIETASKAAIPQD